MTDLTPEEKQRIYQEEKTRLEAQKQIKEAEDRKITKIGCLAILIIFAVVGLWVTLSGGSSSKPKSPDGLDAYVMSQIYVEKQLKAPSSAKFPVFDNSMVVPLGDNRFKVTSYVDAQNSFGAMVRTPYTCTIKNTGGDKWLLETIKLSN